MQFLGTVLYLRHLVLVPQGVVRREAKNMNLLPTALQSHHQCWHYRGGKFKQQCCSASSFTAFNLTFLPHFVALQLFIALFNYSLQCKGCRILKLCSLNQIWKMTYSSHSEFVRNWNSKYHSSIHFLIQDHKAYHHLLSLTRIQVTDELRYKENSWIHLQQLPL